MQLLRGPRSPGGPSPACGPVLQGAQKQQQHPSRDVGDYRFPQCSHSFSRISLFIFD